MKNKIKQFSKGDFKIEQPDIRFSDNQIFMSVSEGEVYEGSFCIENVKGGNIRGLVYPSSFRVHCLEEGFDSNPVCVNFTYDGTGLRPGHIERGVFTVVCNGGEYNLDFTAVIEKPYVVTSYGKVQSVNDFKTLAKQDFNEAKRLFRTRQFYEILKYEDVRVLNLYSNMRKWSLDDQAVEEFLVGIKQKEKIFLSVSETKIAFRDVLEDQKSFFSIKKNTWGYLPIHVSVEGDFIVATRTEYTTEDFVGNILRFPYMIQADKLHAGHNFGRIVITTPYESLYVDVDIHQSSARNEMRGMKGMLAGRGLKEYLSFLAGNMSVDTWVEKATKCVDRLLELEPQNEHYPLLKAHIFIRGHRMEEAKWILENNNHSRLLMGKKPEITAYYLFLTALLKNDTVHSNRVQEELYRVYMKHPYTWQLLCMIINIDKKYKDYNDRLRVLERQFFNGAYCILLYAEAYQCYQENTALLRKLDSFEIQILNFATKYKILTQELALHMADLIGRVKKYDAKLLRILERAYDMYPDPLLLKAICMQLILGHKIGKQYFKWYEAAVEAELKIAQLYEYYMMSMDESRLNEPIPQIVYLYYLHGINLDYQRTAMLYDNLITHIPEESQIYKQYKDQMRTFAMEHLLKRHINDSLRVIYNRFIRPKDITLDELDALYDICHAYHIVTSAKGMKYILVIEEDGSVRQRVPYKAQQGAVIYLYNKAARIVWEADDGLYYTDSIPYESRRLFYEMRFIELCNSRGKLQVSTESGEKVIPLTYDNVKQYGLEQFDKHEVFLLCTKKIREQEYAEDDFMLFLTLALLKEGFYDKAILTYLAQNYCGATEDMKLVWKTAKEYGVRTKSLAERIISQMLFAEELFQEEAIFEDYYSGRPYFRLKQAYLAYAARMFVVKGREISPNIIHMMLQELMQKEYLADICKVAILKYYEGRECETAIEDTLKEFFVELCDKCMIFPFYLSYPQGWLKEVQLYDKVLVEYKGQSQGKLKIHYRVIGDGQSVEGYHAETVLPMYDDVYVKEFVLYEGEELQYYFEEINEQTSYETEKESCRKECIMYEDGKFGRLNLIARLSREKQYEAMVEYKQEEYVASEIFKVY